MFLYCLDRNNPAQVQIVGRILDLFHSAGQGCALTGCLLISGSTVRVRVRPPNYSLKSMSYDEKLRACHPSSFSCPHSVRFYPIVERVGGGLCSWVPDGSKIKSIEDADTVAVNLRSSRSILRIFRFSGAVRRV